MNAGPRIAIDAMGGDTGPAAIVAGIARARRKDSSLYFTLFGDEKVVREELKKHGQLASEVTVCHAPESISASEKPSQAIRRAKTTSMGLAINAVKDGQADAAVSGGNTGALMAMSKLALRTMAGIDRPALAALLPSLGEHDLVMLDLGANTECDAQNLVQFAVMGSAYARVALGLDAPRVGLLSVGEEESKGNDLTREAHQLLKEAPINFIGNVEGRDVYSGEADVIVCDGFTGNVTLKVSEGLVETVEALLHDELAATFGGRVGYVLSRQAFRRFRRRVDYSEYGGAPLVGLNGLCIVGHGRSSAKAVANAVTMAVRAVNEDLLGRLSRDVARIAAAPVMTARTPPPPTSDLRPPT